MAGLTDIKFCLNPRQPQGLLVTKGPGSRGKGFETRMDPDQNASDHVRLTPQDTDVMVRTL